jgi:hypothetical protein
LIAVAVGPCGSNEIYFPRGEDTGNRMGSCYYINFNGKTRSVLSIRTLELILRLSNLQLQRQRFSNQKKIFLFSKRARLLVTL